MAIILDYLDSHPEVVDHIESFDGSEAVAQHLRERHATVMSPDVGLGILDGEHMTKHAEGN